MTKVIIRDFAYPETDKRFHGVNSTSGNGLSDDEDMPDTDLTETDGDEFEDLEDEKQWEWVWSYQSLKPENTTSIDFNRYFGTIRS